MTVIWWRTQWGEATTHIRTRLRADGARQAALTWTRKTEKNMDIGAPELLIILAIVIVVFGVGRIGKLGGELGSALREFRKGLGTDSKAAADEAAAAGDKAAAASAQARLVDTSAASPAPAPSASPAAEQPKG